MSKQEILEQALECFADPAGREGYFDLYSADVVFHGYEGMEPGIESVRRFYAAFWTAFPDAVVEAEEVIELDDRLVVRFAVTGTHQGPFLGVAATGRQFRLPGITILRFRDGKCVERWSVADFLSWLVQVGAFPPGAA